MVKVIALSKGKSLFLSLSRVDLPVEERWSAQYDCSQKRCLNRNLSRPVVAGQ
jgi:hypothetical protein